MSVSGQVIYRGDSGDSSLWSQNSEFGKGAHIHYNEATGVLVIPYGQNYVAKIYPAIQDRSEDGEKEAKILRELDHDHILQLIRTEINNNSNSFVNFFPFYHSGSLNNALHIDHSIPWDKKVRIKLCCQLLSALDFLHSKNILHLDVKPENVLWDSSAVKVVLCDFDTSRENVSAPFRPDPKNLRRTLRFAAYEMYTMEHIFTYTDMYSFGVVFFEIYFGKRAFAKYDGAKLANLHFIMHSGKAVDNIGIPTNCPKFASLLLRNCLLCPEGHARITASRLHKIFHTIISPGVGSSIQESDLCDGLRGAISIDVNEFLGIKFERQSFDMVAESGEILSSDSGGSSSGASQHRLSPVESEDQVLASDLIQANVDEPPTSEFQSDAVDGPPPSHQNTMNIDICIVDPKESPDEFMMFESNHTPQPEVRFVVDRRESVAEDQPIKDSEAMDQQP